MLRSRLLAAAIFLAALAAPAALAAQSDDSARPARFDFAVGLAMNSPADVNQPPKCAELSLPCNTPKTFPDFGVTLHATFHATNHFALAAEASFYDNRWDTVGVNHDYSNHVSAFLMGPQITTGLRNFIWYNDTTRFSAFAQVVGGPESSNVVPTRFAVQPGAGIDFKLRPERLSLRVAYDYRFTQGSPRNLSGSRILCALVFAFPETD